MYGLKTSSARVGELLAALAEGLDELRTRLREKGQVVWLWAALDVKTKVIAALELGLRTQAMAHGLIHALCMVLAPGCIPVFTSDGLNMCFYALTAHFGSWQEQEGKRKPQWVVAAELLYGQVKKHCCQLPPVMGHPWSGDVGHSHAGGVCHYS